MTFDDLEDEISDAISDSIDMDWQSRDGAKAVVRLLNARATPAETAWLIEQDSPARGSVWFSATGPKWRFVSDANEALRFARKIDAETFITWLGGNPLLSNPRATEHRWIPA